MYVEWFYIDSQIGSEETKKDLLTKLRAYSDTPDDETILYKKKIEDALISNPCLLYALNESSLYKELFDPSDKAHWKYDEDRKIYVPTEDCRINWEWDEEKQKYRFFKHDAVGADIVQRLLEDDKFSFLSDEDKKGIVWLVRNHMVPHNFANQGWTSKSIKKFIRKHMMNNREALGADPVKRFDQLGILSTYDTFDCHPGEERQSETFFAHDKLRKEMTTLAYNYLNGVWK